LDITGFSGSVSFNGIGLDWFISMELDWTGLFQWNWNGSVISMELDWILSLDWIDQK